MQDYYTAAPCEQQQMTYFPLWQHTRFHANHLLTEAKHTTYDMSCLYHGKKVQEGSGDDKRPNVQYVIYGNTKQAQKRFPHSK